MPWGEDGVLIDYESYSGHGRRSSQLQVLSHHVWRCQLFAQLALGVFQESGHSTQRRYSDIFAVQGQVGVSVRVLDYAPGHRWSWVSAARTVEKYVAMFGALDWRGGAPPIAFCRLALGCDVLAKAGVGADYTTLAAELPASKERDEDNVLGLHDAQYLAKENALR